MAIVLVFLALALVFACVQASISYHKKRRYSKLHGCQVPPLENPYDFLGFSKIIRSTKTFLAKESLNSTVKLFQQHGNTYTTRVLTSKVIFTCDPQNIRQILITGFSEWESSPLRGHLFRPLLSQSIFQVDGPRWKMTRDTYRHEAHFSNLRTLLDLNRQEKSVQNLLDRIPNGQAFDLYILFRHLMMDLTSGFCLGDSTGSLTLHQSEEKRQFAEAITDIQQRIAASGFVGPLAHLMSKKQMRIDTNIIHSYVGKCIDAALAKPIPYDKLDNEDRETRPYNILSSLAEFTRDKLELRDYVTTILIAGTESTSSLLSSVMYLLARNEHVFLKLRQSVLDIVGRETPTFAQLKSLPYLRCVLNEALRIFPPVPINARVANTETILPTGSGPDGTSPIYIAKGQKIVFSSFAVQRSEQIWGDDALLFKPERWENMSKEKGVGGGAFFPFLMGPRACPGQQYAMTEASYIIVRLLQTYEKIVPRDENHERPWKECMGLNLRNDNGCWVELVRDGEAVV